MRRALCVGLDQGCRTAPLIKLLTENATPEFIEAE